MATPFVQGRLRQEPVEAEIETRCAQCQRQLHITVDSDLRFRVRETGAKPLVFEPSVDWAQFKAPNIIHDY